MAILLGGKVRGKYEKRKKIFSLVPVEIYEIFEEIAKLRGGSLSEPLREFLVMHYDLLKEFYEIEKSKFSKYKKEVSHEAVSKD